MLICGIPAASQQLNTRCHYRSTNKQEIMNSCFSLFARHGRALTGVSLEHTQIVGSV